MDEREWQTFLSVVDEGNITKAAEKLFISQPALSYRIRQLESTIGHSLLLRTTDGIALTPQGEIYYKYCKKMIRMKQALDDEMNSSSGKVQGTLKIAASMNFADYELPALLKSFCEQYPDIHIQVKTAFSYQVVKMFNTGDCMIAFARGGHQVSGKSELLLNEPYCLVYKDLIEPKQLEYVPFIKYLTDSSVGNIIEHWCAENFENPPYESMEVNSMSTCRHFVRAGLGWSILTYMGLGSCRDRDIYVSPLRDKNGTMITRDTNMIYTEDSMKLVAVKTFIDYVRDYYKDKEVIDQSFFREYKKDK